MGVRLKMNAKAKHARNLRAKNCRHIFRINGKWYCHKRDDVFRDIDKHCINCEIYQALLEEMKLFLKECF